MRGLIAPFVLVALVSWIMFGWFEHAQVYHPTRAFDATGRELRRPIEEARFPAADGVALHGWFFPADTNSPRAQLAALICHGNGGNISHRLDLYAALLSLGLNVFAFDYRGYGQSQGRPGEDGTYRDAQAAYRWLREKGFAAENILAYGESLGGAIATELAAREKIGGLVLQSAFTSIPDVGAEIFPWLPVRRISRISYDTRTKLSRVRVPVLILHSREDGMIGFHHAEKNFAAANEPRWLREIPGSHNESFAEPEAILAGMEELLRVVLATIPAATTPRAP